MKSMTHIKKHGRWILKFKYPHDSDSSWIKQDSERERIKKIINEILSDLKKDTSLQATRSHQVHRWIFFFTKSITYIHYGESLIL